MILQLLFIILFLFSTICLELKKSVLIWPENNAIVTKIVYIGSIDNCTGSKEGIAEIAELKSSVKQLLVTIQSLQNENGLFEQKFKLFEEIINILKKSFEDKLQEEKFLFEEKFLELRNNLRREVAEARNYTSIVDANSKSIITQVK